MSPTCNKCHKPNSQPWELRCIECRREYDRNYRRAYRKRPERKQATRLYEHSKERWTKQQARRKARHAVERGLLHRPDTCDRCPNPPAQMHHENYAKPLDVTWLCDACHHELHFTATKGDSK